MNAIQLLAIIRISYSFCVLEEHTERRNKNQNPEQFQISKFQKFIHFKLHIEKKLS